MSKKFDLNAKWLFEVFGKNGTISKSKGKNNYEIIIEDVGVDVDAFTDKPQRIYQEVSLQKVVKKWDKLFSDSSPNAALNYRDLDGGDSESTFVFEMKKPQWNKKSGEIKFAAKQHSGQMIDDLSMSGDLADHAHKSGDPITGKILNSSLFIDTAGDTVQFDKAKDGNTYPVLLGQNEYGGYVLPANAPNQNFNIHPNGGWLTGQKMEVIQPVGIEDARPGSLTGTVMLGNVYNQEWTKDVGGKIRHCTDSDINSTDGCILVDAWSSSGYPNTTSAKYGGVYPMFGIWGADANGGAWPLGINIGSF